MKDIKETVLAGWRESDPAFPREDQVKDKIQILDSKTGDKGITVSLKGFLLIQEGIFIVLKLEPPALTPWKIEEIKIYDDGGNVYTLARDIIYKENFAFLKILPPFYFPCANLFLSFNCLFISSQKDVRTLLEEADIEVNQIIDGELEKGIEMGLSPEEVSRKLKVRSREMVTRFTEGKKWNKNEGKWNWSIPSQGQKRINPYKCERIQVHRKILLQKFYLWVEHITLYPAGFLIKLGHHRQWIDSLLKHKIKIFYSNPGKEKISPLLILREEFFEKSAFLYFPVAVTGASMEYILNNIIIE